MRTVYIKITKENKLVRANRKSGRVDKILAIFNRKPGELISVRQIFQMLYETSDRMSESTIYRLVNMLCDENHLQRKRMPGGQSVFEKTEGKKHDHLVCTECHSTFPLYEQRIESLFTKLAGEHNAKIEDREVVIYVSCLSGLCPREK